MMAGFTIQHLEKLMAFRGRVRNLGESLDWFLAYLQARVDAETADKELSLKQRVDLASARIEKELIMQALKKHRHLHSAAAKSLGLTEAQLKAKLKKHHVIHLS